MTMHTSSQRMYNIETFQKDTDLKLKGANVFIEYEYAIKNSLHDFTDII